MKVVLNFDIHFNASSLDLEKIKLDSCDRLIVGEGLKGFLTGSVRMKDGGYFFNVESEPFIWPFEMLPKKNQWINLDNSYVKNYLPILYNFLCIHDMADYGIHCYPSHFNFMLKDNNEYVLIACEEAELS